MVQKNENSKNSKKSEIRHTHALATFAFGHPFIKESIIILIKTQLFTLFGIIFLTPDLKIVGIFVVNQPSVGNSISYLFHF